MNGVMYSTTSLVLVAIIAGAVVLLLMYILKLFRTDADVLQNKNEKSAAATKKGDSNKLKNKKKVTEVAAGKKLKKKTSRSAKAIYNHHWLMTTLKGHTEDVLDLDFSSNGKYLASCAKEDPDPGGDELNSTNSSNSGSSSSSITSDSPATTPTQTKGLSRRQRKNRRREDSPPDSKKKPPQPPLATKPKKPAFKKVATNIQVPLKQFLKLNLSEKMFADLLQGYLLSYEQMLTMGYPMMIDKFPGCASIYNSNRIYRKPKRTKFDVNAQEFVPKSQTWNDSGQGSGSSSDTESNSSTGSDNYLPRFFYYDGVPCVERVCVRCDTNFFTTHNAYVTSEQCVYHWGKPKLNLHLKEYEFSCCGGGVGARGCAIAEAHVWNGLVNGNNGPLSDFVQTKPSGAFGVYAIDCEMCYTVAGLECTKVTVVGVDGRLVYDTLVKPENEIVDYNTKFSGISKESFVQGACKSLKEVQRDLMLFVGERTILIGHALENDLRALKMLHTMVVDTSCAFPHQWGFPFRRSLKSLSACYLKREIQRGNGGHDSFEDAATCMELMLYLVRHEFKGFLK